MKSVVAIARTATWRRSSLTRRSAPASSLTRSTPRQPRRCGPRARRWWASGSERGAKAPPSIAHLRLHRPQGLAAADAHFFLVRLEAGDDAPAAHLHAGTKPRHIRLAISHRLGLLGERVRRRGHERRERQRRGDCKMTNAHVSPPLPSKGGLKTAVR